MPAPSVLLLSAYRSDSHALWADWLRSELEADWRVLELPGRYFRWRIRGNPLSWLDALPQQLEAGQPQGWQPDRILATSMVDICTLRGLFPTLATVPTSLYFHENQFAYPVSQGQHSSIDPQMVQLYGALAVDELLFNSLFNRDSFLAGIEALLGRLPDALPNGLVERLAPKCRWLPVPVEPMSAPAVDKTGPGLVCEASAFHQKAESKPQRLTVLWNHRWEYDKYPEALLLLASALLKRGLGIDLVLLGHGADRPHAVKQQLEQLVQASEGALRIVMSGFLPKAEYRLWLQQADVVFGAARHEFQGLSLLEAASAGAFPVVPDALCYPEQYPAECLYPVDDFDAAADCMVRVMEAKRAGRPARVDAASLSRWLMPATSNAWRDWLAEISSAST